MWTLKIMMDLLIGIRRQRRSGGLNQFPFRLEQMGFTYAGGQSEYREVKTRNNIKYSILIFELTPSSLAI